MKQESTDPRGQQKVPQSYREVAEARLRNSMVSTEALDLAEAQRIIHELQVHQIELELQNEELQRVYKELEAIRRQYYDLYNFAPIGYVTLNADHRIETVNDTAALLLGENTDKTKLIGKPFTSYIQPESQDDFYLFTQMLSKSTAKQSVVIKLNSSYKSPFFIELEGIRREDNEGKMILFCTFLDITDRVKMEEELKQSVRLKELLLRELHHRVKNNLQMITSLIYLQKAYSTEAAVQETLEKLQGRIQSIHLVYEMLQRSDELSKVNAACYCKSLTEKVIQNLAQHPERIHITYELEEIWLETTIVVSIGLILNEILLNALKYAFPSPREGSLLLRLRKTGQNQLELVIKNDGPSFTEDVLLGQRESLGLQIIRGLLQKHKGTLELKNENGPIYTIRIPHT